VLSAPITAASEPAHAILLGFDGSEDAAGAIAGAGALLGPRRAVVLSAWEPVALWEPYDPASVLSAPLAKLASKELGLDDLTNDLALEKVSRGVALAGSAGFTAEGRVARGKAWRAICDVADEIDAAVIVVGARGLSRVESVLLGSVSSAVIAHAHRPVLIIPSIGHGG
jgi:nucleotide-binding universal stress UspA family protein